MIIKHYIIKLVAQYIRIYIIISYIKHIINTNLVINLFKD